MTSFAQKPLAALFALLLCVSLFPLEIASARPGRGGRGARSGSFRSGGASPRINRNVNLQNRGNISSPSRNRANFQQNRGNISSPSRNRADFQQNRQNQRTDRQGNRQTTRQDRQGERTERTDIRQGERTERTDIRQGERTDRQRNRQDFIDDNYRGGRWYGGGWYGGGYRVPPGWGWATFTTGLVIGTIIATPPPYYSTVYVGSTNYIYSDGVFLEPSGSSYVVVEPPVNVVVNYLPEGCTTVKIDNTTYHNCSDIYYQPFYQNGDIVYKVVEL